MGPRRFELACEGDEGRILLFVWIEIRRVYAGGGGIS